MISAREERMKREKYGVREEGSEKEAERTEI